MTICSFNDANFAWLLFMILCVVACVSACSILNQALMCSSCLLLNIQCSSNPPHQCFEIIICVSSLPVNSLVYLACSIFQTVLHVILKLSSFGDASERHQYLTTSNSLLPRDELEGSTNDQFSEKAIKKINCNFAGDWKQRAKYFWNVFVCVWGGGGPFHYSVG